MSWVRVPFLSLEQSELGKNAVEIHQKQQTARQEGERSLASFGFAAKAPKNPIMNRIEREQGKLTQSIRAKIFFGKRGR